MDWIRWPYESTVQFIAADGVVKTARIRWYFTDDTTPFLRVPTAFYSCQWNEDPQCDIPPGVPGELATGRKNMSKVLPPPAVGVPCGTRKQWLGDFR